MGWDFFLSHASEDKEAVAEPLAHVLSQMGFRVWYDAFELRVGDSLLDKINRGLAESKFGILVLSPHFLKKDWTNAELAALFARDLGGKVLLPVWHGIEKQDLLKRYPLLADRVAVTTARGFGHVSHELVRSAFPDDERRSQVEPPIATKKLRTRFRRLVERGASRSEVRMFVSAYADAILGGFNRHAVRPSDLMVDVGCDLVSVETISSDFSQWLMSVEAFDEIDVPPGTLIKQASATLQRLQTALPRITEVATADAQEVHRGFNARMGRFSSFDVTLHLTLYIGRRDLAATAVRDKLAVGFRGGRCTIRSYDSLIDQF